MPKNGSGMKKGKTAVKKAVVTKARKTTAAKPVRTSKRKGGGY